MPGRYFSCKYCNKPVYRDLKRIHENQKNGWDVFCSQKCLRHLRRKSKTYSCSRVGCHNYFIRKPSELKKIKECYCSTRCAAIVNNSKYVKRPAVIKTCGYCKKSFVQRHVKIKPKLFQPIYLYLR